MTSRCQDERFGLDLALAEAQLTEWIRTSSLRASEEVFPVSSFLSLALLGRRIASCFRIPSQHRPAWEVDPPMSLGLRLDGSSSDPFAGR